MIALAVFGWIIWLALICAVAVFGFIWVLIFCQDWVGDITARISGAIIRSVAAIAVLAIVIGAPIDFGWV